MKDYKEAALQRLVTILSVKTKGGVGGSHLAMAIATALRMSAKDAFATVLVDLDGSTGTSIARMGERDADGRLLDEQSAEAGVVPIDLFDPEERGRLFEVVEGGDRFVILDGPAASLSMFRNLTENLTAADFVAHNRACGRELVVMVPVTPHLASLTTVREAIETFGNDVHYVAVRSMRGCSEGDYVLWNEPEFRNKYGRTVGGRSKAALAAAGGSVLDMPALRTGVLARVEALQVPFHEAPRSTLLTAAERLSVANWLHAWTGQLDTVRGPLGLGDEFTWKVKS